MFSYTRPHNRALYSIATLLIFSMGTNAADQPTTTLSTEPATIVSTKPTVNNTEIVFTQKEKKHHHTKRRGKKHSRSAEKKAAKKNIKDMDFEELKELKKRLLAENKSDAVIKCLEKMIAQCKDVTELKACMLELADALFDTGKLVQAEKMYTEFAKLYPGSDSIETVLYKAILCAYYSTLDAEHDQTKTHDTLAMAAQFLEREELFTTYAGEVKKIKNNCYAKLLENEESITNFYLKRNSAKDLVAAENRIKDMHKDFVHVIPEAESRILALECSLAEKQHDPILLEQKRQAFAIAQAKYQHPTEPITLAAREEPKKFADLF